jgi:hypothetical protein
MAVSPYFLKGKVFDLERLRANPIEYFHIPFGGVSEWLKEHAWKACVREIVPWVRIPPPPPFNLNLDLNPNLNLASHRANEYLSHRDGPKNWADFLRHFAQI